MSVRRQASVVKTATCCPGGEPTEVDHVLLTGICPSCSVRHRIVGWDLMRHVRP